MSILSSFNNLDKRFAWSFLGFMLAAILGSFTVYTEFFRVNTPSIIVELINDANVLDVKEDINELKVFYDDVDIKSLNQTLSVLFLKIKNNGGAPILNGYYDKNYPFNITLEEGKFLKVEQLSSTNEYLKTAAQPRIDTEKRISLPEVILEPAESYTVKILALHNSDSEIKVGVLGKIAGTKVLKIETLNSDETNQSFWGSVFYGGFFVHLVRLPIYFLGLILLVICVLAPIAFASDKISKRKKKKIVTQYKEFEKNKLHPYHEVIFSHYVNHGLSILAELKKTASNEKYWEQIMNDKNIISEKNDIIFDDLAYIERGIHMNTDSSQPYRIVTPSLIKKIGLLRKSEDGKIIFDKDRELALSKFIDFVLIKES